MSINNNIPKWRKIRPYRHLTAKLNPKHRIFALVKNRNYVQSYCFFPLIYKSIVERKYKKGVTNSGEVTRSHSQIINGRKKSTAKNRPIHFSTHKDAVIYSYYSHLLIKKYELLIRDTPLNECVTAYRKLEDLDNKGKGSAHFAKEVFDRITQFVSEYSECTVLTFDIKSFFNTLKHGKILDSWKKVCFNSLRLPNDHYRVYQAVTNFSYVLWDDLKKIGSNSGGSGFDERRLSDIRRGYGVDAFFANPEDFRRILKEGRLPVYKRPFGKMGIP
ncbi:MAG: hypothetical protein ABUT20_63040, partial [Bacteroidota bacterium]